MSDSFFEYNNKMFYKSQVTVGHILSYKYAKRPLFTVGYTVYCDGIFFNLGLLTINM